MTDHISNHFYHQLMYRPTSDEHYGASNIVDDTLGQNATSRLTLPAPPKKVKFKPKDMQITEKTCDTVQPPRCYSQPCTPTAAIAQVQFPIIMGRLVYLFDFSIAAI